MKDLARIGAVIAASLALIAGAVFGAGDSRLLVPPPDAVAESFMRQLSLRRYSRALPYLARPVAERSDVGTLRRGVEGLERRVGPIGNVRGEPGWMEGDRAQARAILETKAGPFPVTVSFVREQGVWAVTEIDVFPLAASSRPVR